MRVAFAVLPLPNPAFASLAFAVSPLPNPESLIPNPAVHFVTYVRRPIHKCFGEVPKPRFFHPPLPPAPPLALSARRILGPGGKIGELQTDRNFTKFHETYALFHVFIALFRVFVCLFGLF